MCVHITESACYNIWSRDTDWIRFLADEEDVALATKDGGKMICEVSRFAMKIVAGVRRHEAQTRRPAGVDGPLRHSFSEASVIWMQNGYETSRYT